MGHEEEDLAGWVQLDHYKNLDLSRAEDAPTPEQVQLQRRKLHETAKLNAMLKAEEARNFVVLEKLRSLTGGGAETENSDASPFSFLTSSPHTSANAASQPLNQNVQYALSQLPALRQNLAQLKESLQTIPNARHVTENEDSVAAKRRLYIDSQSRRALERRGIEPENPESVAAGVGGRIGRDEVEGMEAVVQALGGADVSTRPHDRMEE